MNHFSPPASRITFRALMLALASTWISAFVLHGAEQPPTPNASPGLSAELQKTIVRSERLEARNDGREGHYVFIGKVRITGTNLEITCDRLEIFSLSEKDGNDSPAIAPDSGVLRRLLATGNVTIAQQGRRATCGVAEVLPPEDMIVLTEGPVVTDLTADITMKGTLMRFFRGERAVEIENPEVVGPALPNLGFPNQPSAAPAPSGSGAAPAPAP